MALHLLPLLIFLFAFPSALSQSLIRCHPAERDALKRIQSPCEIAVDSVPDCCSWNHVECDETTGNVIGLNLDLCTGNNTLLPDSPILELRHLRKLVVTNFVLNSSIPKEIEKLTELQVFLLDGFLGPIPSTIGNLKNLVQLDLGFGRLSGSIPDSVGNLKNLTYLSLQRNQLSGSIPDSIGNLTLLETLIFDLNNLSGALPFSIFNLPNLQTLYVGSNRLQGTLPPTIPKHSKLKDFAFYDNLLSGNLPSWLFTSSLENIWGYNNRFSGQIKAFPVPEVSYLKNVQFSNNLLEGIPNSLFLLKNVTYLTLDQNHLSGALDLGLLNNMKNLGTLNVSANEGLSLADTKGPLPPVLELLYIDHCSLTKFPNFLNSVTTLRVLSVRGNKMRGPFDLSKGWESLSNLDASFNFLEGSLTPAPLSLKTLFLSHNNLVGDVPASFCNMAELDLSFNNLNGAVQWDGGSCSGSPMEKLNLRNNKLRGPIPDVFANLRVLLLNGNTFGSKLPRSLANCTGLLYVDVGSNNITDEFPWFLGGLLNLNVLIISSNRFFGNVARTNSPKPFPFPNLLVLDASVNKFTGVVPVKYLQNFNYLTDWEKENRDLYGDQMFINFKGSRVSISEIFRTGRSTFASLDLSENQFSGGIPPEMGNMEQLRGLNLKKNKLTGGIPTSFGKLVNLESLDLSSNMLSGRIPKELVGLKSLVYLNLSYNLLQGPIPIAKTFSNASYVGNVNLCGFPLSKHC